MSDERRLELPIRGMDCADCAVHVRQAIAAVPGVRSAEVLLSAEKAIVLVDPARVDLSAIRRSVEQAGYAVGAVGEGVEPRPAHDLGAGFGRSIFALLGVVFGLVLFLVVVGEVFGLLDAVTERVPWPVWLALIVAGGLPIFRAVLRALLQRRILAQTLMTVGMLAAIAVGEWATALLVVFFMRMANSIEGFTTERARRAVRDLSALAPSLARVERDGVEVEVPVEQVRVGDVVVVRPGEQVPVDGEVVAGQATIDQAAITGESMPVEAEPGSRVFAATFARLGSLRVRATRVGADTTFGRVIRLVEQAETHRADVQRLADRFATWYLPVVAAIAALTFLLSGNALATAAVLVVACSCSFALATPVAVIASVGAAARRGLLIKGGRYLEALARADVVLLDKTGTLTLGRPRLTDVVPLNGLPEGEALRLAATAERYSEHPLAEAVRAAARERGLRLGEPERFEAIPGAGVRARVDGRQVAVGNHRLIATAGHDDLIDRLDGEGKTVMLVERDGLPVAVLAAADTPRPEVPAAIAELRALGIARVELLTGDNERVAAALAGQLGIAYRANLLPEDKIAKVQEYQAAGHTVVMVGDGVNDAPALAQADVGIAMGAAGSDVAIEAAHVAVMRDDWTLVPDVFRVARRTMRVVRLNLGLTALYNLTGLSLAAFGILPPALAAAAQSIPDIGILGNSSRLLRQPLPRGAAASMSPPPATAAVSLSPPGRGERAE